MAWPPAPLPTNRTNATPQQDLHPVDHNALALAINDTVAQIQATEAANIRRGVGLSQTGQSFGAQAAANMAWSTENYDVGNFFVNPGDTNVTVPPDGRGVYVVTLSLTTSGPVNGLTRVAILIGAAVKATFIPVGQTTATVVYAGPLNAGNVVLGHCWSGHTAAMFVSGSIELNRVAST